MLFFFGQIGNFLSEIGKKPILFCIVNGAEFWPQNRVIESPVFSDTVLEWCHNRHASAQIIYHNGIMSLTFTFESIMSAKREKEEREKFDKFVSTPCLEL